MAASVTRGRALRYAEGSARGLLHHHPGHCPYFAMADTRPPVEVMVDFIEAHRDAHGVEPICAVLPIAPSTYYDQRISRTRRMPRAAFIVSKS